MYIEIELLFILGAFCFLDDKESVLWSDDESVNYVEGYNTMYDKETLAHFGLGEVKHPERIRLACLIDFYRVSDDVRPEGAEDCYLEVLHYKGGYWVSSDYCDLFEKLKNRLRTEEIRYLLEKLEDRCK